MKAAIDPSSDVTLTRSEVLSSGARPFVAAAGMYTTLGASGLKCSILLGFSHLPHGRWGTIVILIVLWLSPCLLQSEEQRTNRGTEITRYSFMKTHRARTGVSGNLCYRWRLSPILLENVVTKCYCSSPLVSDLEIPAAVSSHSIFL
ncbi:hypothetical protein ZOSMA_61G00090 [Zostera marina]|uniref:Uncharacterized protein n=1 Tax=Zostera marina TaxID=29655 RepID=A0A0K9NTS7_ZOSMR|nr:hypothetical protein ZOSMA_61G00090 [Zostera marina]